VLFALLVACRREDGRARPEASARSTAHRANPAQGGPASIGGGPRSRTAEDLRGRLVDELALQGLVHDTRVLTAMRKVPRHLFLPPGYTIETAYEDVPLPIGHEQTISQPTVVGMMTQALDLRGKERVLEIGTGSGYQAAILSLLAADVYSIELIAPLADEARARLNALGYPVHVRAGDGYLGWPEAAPFDRIIVTAAPPKIPQALVDQLVEGGIMVVPIGPEGGVQDLSRLHKEKGVLRRESLGPVMFVPMVPGKD